MSKMSKRTLIATTVIGAFALGNSAVVSADPLNDLHKEEAKIHVAAKNLRKKLTLYLSNLRNYWSSTVP